MEERHRCIVAQRARCEAAVEFGEHVLGHGMRVGERLGADLDPHQLDQFGVRVDHAFDPMGDAGSIRGEEAGIETADAELVELVWVEIGSQPLADAHAMTKNVLAELDRRLATGPLKHDAPVPFFHFYGGKMQKDVLGA